MKNNDKMSNKKRRTEKCQIAFDLLHPFTQTITGETNRESTHLLFIVFWSDRKMSYDRCDEVSGLSWVLWIVIVPKVLNKLIPLSIFATYSQQTEHTHR
jgi:hypothetical protein